MASLTEAHRAFLRNPFYGVFTTLRQDGTPHSTVIWFDVEDGEVILNTARGRAKDRHLARDPRAGLTVVDPSDPYRWVAISGTAELTEEGADAIIDRLSQKYIGKDYPWRQPDETRVTIRLRPERVDALGL